MQIIIIISEVFLSGVVFLVLPNMCTFAWVCTCLFKKIASYLMYDSGFSATAVVGGTSSRFPLAAAEDVNTDV